MSVSVERHPAGITWIESGAMARAAHGVVDDGRVWLIDPFEDAEALAAVAGLGDPAGVIQLLDRHERDGKRIATRLGVPLLRLPDAIPESPFTVMRVIKRPKWHEIALWWAARRTLIVPEAVGTAPLLALGRRVGVHPMLRLLPPRSALKEQSPECLLVGHGPPVLSDAADAIDVALAHARSDIPKLVISLPAALLHR